MTTGLAWIVGNVDIVDVVDVMATVDDADEVGGARTHAGNVETADTLPDPVTMLVAETDTLDLVDNAGNVGSTAGLVGDMDASATMVIPMADEDAPGLVGMLGADVNVLRVADDADGVILAVSDVGTEDADALSPVGMLTADANAPGMADDADMVSPAVNDAGTKGEVDNMGMAVNVVEVGVIGNGGKSKDMGNVDVVGNMVLSENVGMDEVGRLKELKVADCTDSPPFPSTNEPFKTL